MMCPLAAKNTLTNYFQEVTGSPARNPRDSIPGDEENDKSI
jgi:hypothetical protein